MSHGLSKRIKYQLRKEFEGYRSRLARLEAPPAVTVTPAPIARTGRSPMSKAFLSVGNLALWAFAALGVAFVGGYVAFKTGVLSLDQILASAVQMNGYVDYAIAAIGGGAGFAQWLRVLLPERAKEKEIQQDAADQRLLGMVNEAIKSRLGK